MVFITYNNITRAITGVYPTQDAANADATTTNIAVSGNITTARRGNDDIEAINVTDDGLWFYHSSAPNVRDVAFLPSLRDSFIAVNTSIHSLTELLLDVQEYYPADDVTKAHEIIRRLYQGVYMVGTSSWDPAQKLQWIGQSALGTTDVPARNPIAYFDIAHDIELSAIDKPISLPAIDTSGSTPTFAQQTLAAAIAQTVVVTAPPPVLSATLSGGVLTFSLSSVAYSYSTLPTVTIPDPSSGTTATVTFEFISGSSGPIQIATQAGGTGYASVPTLPALPAPDGEPTPTQLLNGNWINTAFPIT